MWPAVESADVAGMSARQVRLALWCMARLSIVDVEVVRRLAHRAGQVAASMDGFLVSNTVWALGVLGVGQVDITPLVHSFVGQLHKTDGHNCSSMIYAMHQVGWVDPEHYLEITTHFAGLGSEVPQQYSNILWAVSQRSKEPPQELGVLVDGLLACRDKAKPQDFSNALLALNVWCTSNAGQVGTLLSKA